MPRHGIEASSTVTNSLRLALSRRRALTQRLFALDLHPTAAAILDQGAKIVASSGGAALSMRTVAKLVDIKLASLQYHFRTFDAFIEALFAREFGRVADLLWAELLKIEASVASPSDALRRAASTFMVEGAEVSPLEDKLYFPLLVFCAYHESAKPKLRAFFDFYNALMAFLVSQVNPNLDEEECMDRAIMITTALEGANIYAVLWAGGTRANEVVHRDMGELAYRYAALPHLR
jgi:AcrR family transcriptional regulator